MQIYNGKSVFGGIAIGKISVYQKKEQQVKRVKIDDPEQEMARYDLCRHHREQHQVWPAGSHP